MEATAREVRITNHGKMTNWVSMALKHFETDGERPLVLHTLPALKGKAVAAGNVADNGDGRSELGGRESGAESKGEKGKAMAACMSTIPRLVSVVEIIKREYLKTLDPQLAEAGVLSGLHQYNEIGDVGEAGYGEKVVDDDAEDRTEALVRALQGRRHLQQKKVAFMRVTLSTRPLSGLAGTTYQRPSVRRLSKSARARLKKKKPQN